MNIVIAHYIRLITHARKFHSDTLFWIHYHTQLGWLSEQHAPMRKVISRLFSHCTFINTRKRLIFTPYPPPNVIYPVPLRNSFWTCLWALNDNVANNLPFAYPKQHNGDIYSCPFLCISVLSACLGMLCTPQWLVYILDFLPFLSRLVC